MSALFFGLTSTPEDAASSPSQRRVNLCLKAHTREDTQTPKDLYWIVMYVSYCVDHDVCIELYSTLSYLCMLLYGSQCMPPLVWIVLYASWCSDTIACIHLHASWWISTLRLVLYAILCGQMFPWLSVLPTPGHEGKICITWWLQRDLPSQPSEDKYCRDCQCCLHQASAPIVLAPFCMPAQRAYFQERRSQR